MGHIGKKTLYIPIFPIYFNSLHIYQVYFIEKVVVFDREPYLKYCFYINYVISVT